MLSRIRAVAGAAREKGTLKSIETTHVTLNSNPQFVVRVLKKVSEKSEASNNAVTDPTGSAPKPKINPFLPYEPSMYVQALGGDHVLLLNKFNVVEDHSLIVTREFEEQNSLLNGRDFSAAWMCLTEVGGLVFYNAGRIAGASQRHKHLQHVGGSLIPGGEGITPFDTVLARGNGSGIVYGVQELEVLHGIMGMKDVGEMAARGETKEAGVVTMQRYTELLRVVSDGVDEREDVSEDNDAAARQPFAYNLVMTRDWIMVVPRRRECFEGISVNSLGFVGCLLVRDVKQKNVVRDAGGMTVLRAVAFPQS